MSPSTTWSAGRYEAVARRIARIAEEVVDAVERRRPLAGAAVLDLACGTGNAALTAAARGARVTGVDITPELLAIAAQHDTDGAVDWRAGDASDTGLPAAAFDALVSNMGIIFVDPRAQIAEIDRLLRPGGVLAFSSWVRDTHNPLFDPVVAVLGPPDRPDFSPDQWGDEDTVTDRLAPGYDDIDIRPARHTWEFETLAAAMHFLREESPMHVDTFRRVDEQTRDRLAAAFADALREHVDASGAVRFSSSYVVISAVRRS